MDTTSIISYGFEHGKDLVAYNWNYVTITEDMDYDEYLEAIRQLAWEADDGYRQYSPFEFFAKDLNEMEDPDEAWGMYEDAINAGIEDAINKFVEADFDAAREELFGDVE